MGMIGMTMPLLSTLAALVIIVHSAEEDMSRGLDPEHRYDMAPEIIDTGTGTLERRWRPPRTGQWAPHVHRINQESTPMENWTSAPAPEQPKRRRAGRWRKRLRPATWTDYEEEMQQPPGDFVHVPISFNDHGEQHQQTMNGRKGRRKLMRKHTTTTTKEGKTTGTESSTNRIRDRLAEFDEFIPGTPTEPAAEQTLLTEQSILTPTTTPRHDLVNKLYSYEVVDNHKAPEKETSLHVYEPKAAPNIQGRRKKNRKHFRDYRDFDDNTKGTQIVEAHYPTVANNRSHHKREQDLSEFSAELKDPAVSQDEHEDREKLGDMADTFPTITSGFHRKQNTGVPTVNQWSPTPLSKAKMQLHVMNNKKTIKDFVKDLLWNNIHMKKLDKTSDFNQKYLGMGTNVTIPPLEKNFAKANTKMSSLKTDGQIYLPLFQFPSLDQLFEMTGGGEPNMKQLPLNPVSLKDILKRSNGTSLSEILQQHNLTLADLLKGKEDALSVLTTDKVSEKQHRSVDENLYLIENENEESQHKDQTTQSNTHNNSDGTEHENIGKDIDLESQSSGRDRKPQARLMEGENENETKTAPKQRSNVRRRLRLRASPMNNMHKSPLSRDFMANSARKYHNNRNMTKSKQWKYVLPMMPSTDSSEETYIVNESNEPIELLSTTTSAPEVETTILPNSEYYNPSTVVVQVEDIQTTKPDNEIQNETETETVPVTTIFETTTTDKPKVSRLRPQEGRMGLRRQSYNNRMKRKRMKQRISTTETPPDGIFGVPNLVSSSEFIARTQTPQNQNAGNEEDDFTTLEDFFTTEKAKVPDNGQRYTRNSTIPSAETGLPMRAPIPLRFSSTTEETAKFEIEEILNDTRTSARLSKILMERNMTLNELVEHRERGSSHVHLADIFHNASKEPNPPEPFLSKSSIEPISKETYPLRAILEANLHEAAPKANKVETGKDHPDFVNIPIAMNFGNNVNENGENMGIMTLFNELAGHDDVTSVENTSTGKDSEGTPYITTIFAVNHTTNNDTALEGKAMKNEENNFKNDVLGWDQLFKLIKRSQKNSSDENEAIKDSMLESENQELIEGLDDNGLMAYEDLQGLKDFDITIGSENKISIDAREELGILDPQPNRAKSVTIATASIVGLAMILFLLTYAVYKWKQQRSMLRNKQMYPDEKIPTPVFENRKGHKNNCSTRSISPMLNSNIYTMNTLDSSNGKESPDYMWDSLRKPFQ